MKIFQWLDSGINIVTELFGYIGWILILYCALLGTIGVFLRYALDAPSLWIGSTLQAAMVVMACVGGAFALNRDAFVKVDVFYARLSARGKAVSDILTVAYSLMFVSVLIWQGIKQAQVSLMLSQTTPGAVPLPLAPFKILIPIGASVILLVIAKKFVRDVKTIIGPNNI